MTPITFERLEKAGFSGFNCHFTYMCFPEPLHGEFRIDYYDESSSVRPVGWKIESGYTGLWLRNVEFMEQVANFYKGICDKDMEFNKK